MTITKEEIESIAAETVRKERKPITAGVLIILLTWVFTAGIIYAQVQGNTKEIEERKSNVQQIPLIVQKLEAVEKQGEENKKEVKEVQRVQQQILLEIRGLGQQLSEQ